MPSSCIAVLAISGIGYSLGDVIPAWLKVHGGANILQDMTVFLRLTCIQPADQNKPRHASCGIKHITNNQAFDAYPKNEDLSKQWKKAAHMK
jgi:hypothetical protein